VVDRAGAERAAEHEHRQLPGLDAELGAGGRAVGDRRRDGAAGHEVAVAVAALDREREADTAGAVGEQAVGEAEVRVGLREHERRAAEDGGEADRAGDVATAAQHGVGPAPAQQPGRAEQRGEGLQKRPDRLQRVGARDAFDIEAVDLVPRRRDELGLGALAAREVDLGALSPKRVGDRDRRNDVARRPARRDHDSCFVHGRPPRPAGAPIRRSRR
jgi:hypothetical protein